MTAFHTSDDFIKAARLCPKVCGKDPNRWEGWIFVFAEKQQLQVILSMRLYFLPFVLPSALGYYPFRTNRNTKVGPHGVRDGSCSFPYT